MLPRRDPKSAKLAIVIWAIAINALLFFFVAKLFFGIQVIDETWRSLATHSIKHATHLAEIERNMGYVGFIHHFKNYVIRGSEEYYVEAEKSYRNATQLLERFQAETSDKDDIKRTQLIQQTLDDYYAKLQLIKESYDSLAIEALDARVRVDDSPAEKALITLRQKLIPELEKSTVITDQLVAAQKANTLFAAVILLPVFIFSSFVTVRLLNLLSQLTTEYETIFNMSPDGILFIDDQGRILRTNQAAANMLEYRRDELKEMYVEDLMEDAVKSHHRHYREAFSQREQSRQMRSLGSAIKGKTKSGATIDLSIAISTRLVHERMHSVCILRDITAQNELKEQAERDHLTSIYNRRTLESIVVKEIDRSVRLHKPLSLLLVDIDNFKQINDSLGHQRGDEAIQVISDHLLAHIRAYDHLGRWGGDEFLILCPELDEDGSISFAQRLQSSIHTLDPFYGQTLTLSIGIATHNGEQHVQYQQVLKAADEALYRAKEAGRDRAIHARQATT